MKFQAPTSRVGKTTVKEEKVFPPYPYLEIILHVNCNSDALMHKSRRYIVVHMFCS